MEAQWWQAGAVVLAYAALCWACLARRTVPPEQPAGATLLVAFASQGGEAEAMARRHADLLGRRQPVALLALNQVSAEALAAAHTALFIASTYGEGEPPDNALRFSRRWLESRGRGELGALRYAVLALGDSNYRRFCAFGERLDAALAARGARRLFDLVRVDRMDDAALAQWQRGLARSGLLEDKQQLPLSQAPLREHPVLRCRLLERKLLNAGSPGGPVYHLRLSPPQNAAWQSGDIALIDIPSAGAARPAVREYSIASIPSQGGLDLLVRQVRKPDGSLGLGSGWLTAQLQLGADIVLRVRDNPAFHAPRTDAPMILVGNGTGMAGLRAHLQARAQAGHVGNWLVFGERSRSHDRLFDTELMAWQRSGQLQRLDRVFSREGEKLCYVQDFLTAHTADLERWLQQGASIYVCGSQQGMAPAVHRVLLDLLGERGLEDLTLDGRYRRDVY